MALQPRPPVMSDRRSMSGFTGVYWYERGKNWKVSIGINGKNEHLGCFHNLDDAVKCRQEAEAGLPPRRPTLIQPFDPTVRLIPLTKGQIATIDADDYQRVAARYWVARWNKYTQSYYAHRPGYEGCMHRFILGLTDPDIECDHRNGDTLDNRKANLRCATHAQNGQNRKPRKNNKNGHSGVCWDKCRKKWEASICVSRKKIFLGRFKNIDDAIKARQAAEAKYFGEFAYTARPNLPPKKPPVGDDAAYVVAVSN